MRLLTSSTALAGSVLEAANILAFTYGHIINNLIIWLTGETIDNPLIIQIANFQRGVVKICSAKTSCLTKIANLTTKERFLTYNKADFNANTINPDLIPSAVIYFSSIANDSDSYRYFFNIYLKYFRKLVIDTSYLDVYLDCTIEVLNNSYALKSVAKSEIDDSTVLLIEVLQNYTESITDSQFQKFLLVTSIIIEKKHAADVIKILELVSLINTRKKPLNFIFHYYNQNFTIYRKRGLGNEFTNFTTDLEVDSIKIENISLKDTGVYDLVFNKFTQTDVNFEFSFYETGSFDRYNYYPSQNSTLESIELEKPIYLGLSGRYNPKADYECAYLKGSDWITGGCNIFALYNSFILAELSHLSTFRIQQVVCEIGSGPIVTMSIMIFLFTILGIIFRMTDKNVKNWPTTYKIMLYYPLTSLFIKQPKFRRSIIALQILSSELLLLTIIGACYIVFGSPKDFTRKSFNNYHPKELPVGATALALTTVFTVPVFILNVMIVNRKRLELVSIPIMIVVSLGSVAGMGVMTFRYCNGWTEYWIINYFIFMFIDLITLQLICAIILAYLVKIEEEEKTQMKEIEVLNRNMDSPKSAIISQSTGREKDEENRI